MKLSLFADDMILYRENAKNSTFLRMPRGKGTVTGILVSNSHWAEFSGEWIFWSKLSSGAPEKLLPELGREPRNPGPQSPAVVLGTIQMGALTLAMDSRVKKPSPCAIHRMPRIIQKKYSPCLINSYVNKLHKLSYCKT